MNNEQVFRVSRQKVLQIKDVRRQRDLTALRQS